MVDAVELAAVLRQLPAAATADDPAQALSGAHRQALPRRCRRRFPSLCCRGSVRARVCLRRLELQLGGGGVRGGHQLSRRGPSQ